MATLDESIVVHYSKQFDDNVRLLAQQMDHRLAGTYITGNLVGEEGFTETLGKTEFQKKNQRFQEIDECVMDEGRRKYTTDFFWWARSIDTEDKLKMLVDMQSKYMMAAKAAANRKRDQILLNALIGTAYTGKDGTTAVTLPSTQKIDDAGTTAMTLDKLASIVKTFKDRDVMDQTIYIAWSPEAESQLMADSKVTSMDYNTQRVLMQGKLEEFYGCKFILTNLLGKSSTTRTCIAWTADAVELAVSQEVRSDISQRKNIVGLPWRSYMDFSIGATRLEEEKVIQFGVKEAA